MNIKRFIFCILILQMNTSFMGYLGAMELPIVETPMVKHYRSRLLRTLIYLNLAAVPTDTANQIRKLDEKKLEKVQSWFDAARVKLAILADQGQFGKIENVFLGKNALGITEFKEILLNVLLKLIRSKADVELSNEGVLELVNNHIPSIFKQIPSRYERFTYLFAITKSGREAKRTLGEMVWVQAMMEKDFYSKNYLVTSQFFELLEIYNQYLLDFKKQKDVNVQSFLDNNSVMDFQIMHNFDKYQKSLNKKDKNDFLTFCIIERLKGQLSFVKERLSELLKKQCPTISK